MSFSGASSRERTLLIVLAVVIVVALIGIGLLLAKLLVSGGGEQAGGITPAPTTTADASAAEPTITPIDAPALQPADQPPGGPTGGEPVVLVRAESVGPLAPAMLVNQALQSGHQYRLEVTAQDGSAVAVEGNWSQAATSASGQATPPQIEFFEGTTPYQVDIAPPVADPEMWSVSVSAGLRKADVLGDAPKVVITIWDVTGSQ